MTKETFQERRKEAKMSQQEWASRLGITQRHVSLLEAGKVTVPALMADAVERGLSDAIIDDQFSLPFHIHEHFWNRANTRAAAVTMTCWIKPSKFHGFGEIRSEIRFDQLKTSALRASGATEGAEGAEDAGLVLDLLSNPNVPKGKPSPIQFEWPEDTSNVFPKEVRAARPACIAARAKCSYKRLDHKVIYRIWGADGYEPVTINMYCRAGFVLDSLDTVGFPLYPDFVIERLSFRVHLHNLVCRDPELPPFTPFLIRRANDRAVPANLRSKYQAVSEVRSNKENVFSFGPLLRPAPGYIYGLTWTKLVPTTTPREAK